MIKHGRMSPCFSGATLWIVGSGYDIGQKPEAEIDTTNWPDLAWGQELMRRNVNVLLCAGVEHFLHGVLQGYGVDVVPDAFGLPSEVMKQWRKDKLMKIVITSLGETLDSPIDQRFGRARYFILYDTETEKWSAHDNQQNLNASQGAGIQAGQKVVALEAAAVITGHCGPKAFATLKAGNIDIYPGATGTVKEAIDAFSAGEYKKSENADVVGHFGSV
jgi:predicted Fe-Mo cluster-binding NifX family protein